MKKLILFLFLMGVPVSGWAGEVIEKQNQYGGITEIEIPEDTNVREYMKKFYDDQGFLVVLEEKFGSILQKEVSYFLSRTYFSREREDQLVIELFIKPTESEKEYMDGRYKEISLYIQGHLVKKEEYYSERSSSGYAHIRILEYDPVGTIQSEKTIPLVEQPQ